MGRAAGAVERRWSGCPKWASEPRAHVNMFEQYRQGAEGETYNITVS